VCINYVLDSPCWISAIFLCGPLSLLPSGPYNSFVIVTSFTRVVFTAQG
jgi:hypothetical protein